MAHEFKPVLELDANDLRVRRSQLEAELKVTITELLFTETKARINALLVEYGVTNAQAITWEFYYESDDEGGTNPYLSSVWIDTEDGGVDPEDFVIVKKSRWSDSEYEHSLGEELSELMYDYKHDLHEYDITEIAL